MIFGAVTLGCFLAAMVLSVNGQYPMLMIPIAIACTIVFIRHGDGREHSVNPARIGEDESRGHYPAD
jgi:hypothetical protein